MTIELVIFDWDGVAVDSVPIIFNGVCAVLRHFGVKPQTLAEFYGVHCQPYLRYYQDFGILVQDHEIRRVYDPLVNTDKAKFFPGFRQLVLALDCLSIPMAIVSSHPRQSIVKRLKRMGISELFKCIVGNTQDKTEELLYVCDWFDVRPWQAIFVGDMISDMRDGNFAGLETVGFDAGYGSYRVLITAGANHCIFRHSQILSIIMKE